MLALVVFAGGTEATITGALLLGFGFGWALMATLTVRRTRQPQRWAVVPAVAMGATGAALVVFTPGNQTMTALELGVAAADGGAHWRGCSSRCAAR